MSRPSPYLRSPYPYFGGKATIMKTVWKRFGKVRNFVDPFFGGGSALLGRPEPWVGKETVNDLNGYIANFWRALTCAPEVVAHYADWPVNENDLHARHAWLVERKDSLQAQLEGDPEWYDAQVAGWWVWGMALWIGGGFCSGEGPWRAVTDAHGRRLLERNDSDESGVSRKRIKLTGNSAVGVHRKRVHLGNTGQGVRRRLVNLGAAGQGAQRRRVELPVSGGRGVSRQTIDLYDWFDVLQARLERVRVCCGDWRRVVTPAVTTTHGLTAVFLDPPYSAESGRAEEIYTCEDLEVAHAVREWALAHGDDPLFRIALCGLEGEHSMPRTWECYAWKAHGGMARGEESRASANRGRERVWFSPHCLKEQRYPLFERDERDLEEEEEADDTGLE